MSEILLNHKHYHPWGYYEYLLVEPEYRVKRITISKDNHLSYKYHSNRDEYWTVVSGVGEIIIDEVTHNVETGFTCSIPKKCPHAAHSNGDKLVIIETQVGQCDELDTFRIYDAYGRPHGSLINT